MRPTDCRCRGFRHAKVFYLALLNQILDRSRHVFDWHLCVNAVLIKQIDRVDPESFQGALHALLDVLGPAVQTYRTGTAIMFEFEPEFRRDHHLSAERSASPTSYSFANGP